MGSMATVVDTPFDTLITFCNWTELSLRESPSSSGKYMTAVYLGEQFDITGDTASEVSNGKRVRYHKVKLMDNKQGWVQDDFIAIDAARGVLVKDAVVCLRPDQTSVSDKKFSVLDFVAVRPSTSGFVEVTGKPAGGTWFQKGYVRESDLSFNSADVNLSVLYRRAMETKDQSLRGQRLSQLRGAGFDASPLYAVIFPSDTQSNNDSDGFISYTFDNTFAERRGGSTLENNGVTFVADKDENPNAAAYFDGQSSFLSGEVNEDHVNITYLAWIKAEKTDHAIIPFLVGNGCTSGYGINIDENMHLMVLCGGVTVDASGSEYYLPLNEWVHIALVKEGNTFSVYINGELSSTGSTNYNALNGEFTIGAATGCNGTPYGSFFAGAIDDFYVAHKAMSQEEVVGIMDPGD